jgi:signal transduction histidine kinase
VLLSGDAPSDQLSSAVLALSSQSGAWAPLLLRTGAEGLTVTPIVVGDPESLEGALGRIRGEEMNSGLLSYRGLLRDLSRIRHDINNPLTAAFAEVQLLIMDVEPGTELGEALAIVEEQLFRIRDLVAELSSFRSTVR